MGFRATLNFRNFKVALNPMNRLFLNFAKTEGFFFFIATQKTLPAKPRQKRLSIPLTIRYLNFVLYNTPLEYNSYTAFTVCLLLCLFFNYTPMYLANYNAELVST